MKDMSHPAAVIYVHACVFLCVCECVAGSGHKWERGSCDASLCQGMGETDREGGGRRGRKGYREKRQKNKGGGKREEKWGRGKRQKKE